MAEPAKRVCPKAPIPKSHLSAALAVSWARTAQTHGKGVLADAVDGSTKLIDRALTGESVPELHTALNSLRLCPMALDEVFEVYGLHSPRPRLPEAQNDLETVSGLSGLVAEFCAALADGHRDHRETIALVNMVRPLMPALTQIMREADRLRGVEAA